jgi:hypothetical protein
MFPGSFPIVFPMVTGSLGVELVRCGDLGELLRHQRQHPKAVAGCGRMAGARYCKVLGH